VYALFTISNIFCDQSVITGTEFVEQRVFTALSRLRFEGFSRNSPTPVTARALLTKGLNLSSANNKEHIILGKYLCFISWEFSETPPVTARALPTKDQFVIGQ